MKVKVEKIYKIRGWVNVKRDRKGNLQDHPFMKEIVIVNDLKYAKACFDSMKNEVEAWKGYSKYPSGACELFEPHIHENGLLAYWPDKENYIERFSFGGI